VSDRTLALERFASKLIEGGRSRRIREKRLLDAMLLNYLFKHLKFGSITIEDLEKLFNACSN
jgi:hypothetical protein